MPPSHRPKSQRDHTPRSRSSHARPPATAAGAARGRSTAAAALSETIPTDTAWEKSAQWYDRLIGEKGSDLYRQVVLPKALALLAPKRGESIIDLGCGQGVFSRVIASSGARVTGLDASPTLIESAKNYRDPNPIRFLVGDAAQLQDLGPFDAAACILSLQNMSALDKICQAAADALQAGGRMLWVLNHPCFRIPKQTSWGFDPKLKIQYRRADAYTTPMRIPIVMHPGRQGSETTLSFHHSLADLSRMGFNAGLRLRLMEEWHSHKHSQPGPRAKAENRARAEFPLFLALLWEKPAQLPNRAQ